MSVCSSVCSFVRPSVQPALQGPKSQPGRPYTKPVRPQSQLVGWLALKPTWPSMRPDLLALRPAWLGLRPAWLALGPSRGGRTDGRTDGRTYGRKISPFYRTSSPIGAAAQKQSIVGITTWEDTPDRHVSHHYVFCHLYRCHELSLHRYDILSRRLID